MGMDDVFMHSRFRLPSVYFDSRSLEHVEGHQPEGENEACVRVADASQEGLVKLYRSLSGSKHHFHWTAMLGIADKCRLSAVHSRCNLPRFLLHIGDVTLGAP